MTTTDAELLRRADDHAAFAEFVGRHHVPVLRYATRRLGPSHAEDITSETFTVAFQRAGRFDPDRGDARAWLLGIATNLIRRHARTEAKMLKAYAASGRDPLAGPDAPDVAVEAALAGALAALRPQHRDVLLLHAVAGLSHEEIAEAMDIPIGTARGWLSRARATAAHEMAKHGVVNHNVDPNAEVIGS